MIEYFYLQGHLCYLFFFLDVILFSKLCVCVYLLMFMHTHVQVTVYARRGSHLFRLAGSVLKKAYPLGSENVTKIDP